MDSTIMLTLIELAKLGLSSYFRMMQLAGRTPEETTLVFLKEWEKFKSNAPDTLPDV